MARPKSGSSGPSRASGRKRSRLTDSPDPEDYTPIYSDSEPEQNFVPQKRAKRAVIDDHEQLTQENNAASQHSQPAASQTTHTSKSSKSKRARFSEPPRPLEEATITLGSPEVASTSYTSHTHVRKTSRHSLPAQLPETPEGQQIQYEPLSAVIDSRTRRILRRSHLSEAMNDIEEHQKEDAKTKEELKKLRQQVRQKDEQTKQLELELEIMRQNNIDIGEPGSEGEAKEQEIAQLHKEIAELKSQAAFAGSQPDTDDFGDDDTGAGALADDDELTLIEPKDIGLSQNDMETEPHPNGFYASFSTSSKLTSTQTSYDAASTQITLPDPNHEEAVEHFESEVYKLSHELATTKANLVILETELRNLGFAHASSTTEEILQTIRQAFREAREKLDILLPGNGTADLTNPELLSALTEHVKGLLAELKEKTELAEKHNQMEKLLQAQNNGLLNKLSEFEERNQTLEEQWQALDVDNEQNRRTVVELQEELATAHQELDTRDKELTDLTAQVHGLQDETEDQATTVERLQKALIDYRNEVASLEELVSHTEEQNKAKLEEVEADHAEIVQTFENQIAEQTQALEDAADVAEQKQAFIADLEARIDQAAQQFEQLQELYAQVNNVADTEQAGRVAAETELADKAAAIEELENQLDTATSELKDLRAQLDALQENFHAENQERQALQADLDQRNAQVAELQQMIQDAGIQANQLRSKIWEVQQEREKTVTSLNNTLEIARQEYDRELGESHEQHEVTRQGLENLTQEYEELQQQLAAAEKNVGDLTGQLNETITQRDESLARLDTELDTLNQQYEALQQDTSLQITTLESTIRDLNNTLTERNSTIERLQNEAAAEAHEHLVAVENKDEEINGLSTQLMESRAEIERLAKDKASLEDRVNHEAVELLNMDARHADEIAALNSTIRTQKKALADMTKLNERTVADHAVLLAAKEQEITDLRVTADSRASTISSLGQDLEDMRARFLASQQDASDTIAAMQQSLAEALAKQDDLAAGWNKRAQDTVDAVAEMKTKGVTVHTNGATEHKTRDGRVKKVKENVRVEKKKGRAKTVKNRQWRDSGIGAPSDEEEQEVNGVEADEGMLLEA